MPQPKLDITTELAAADKALAPALKRVKAALAKVDVEKLPTGALADLLYALRNFTKPLSTLLAGFDEVVDPKAKELEEHFIKTLAVGEMSGVQGAAARVQITESAIPTVAPEDWTKVWAHIKKTGEWDLMNRAINRAAVVERWNNKKQVPGVGKFIAKKVSCTKLNGKGK